MEAEGGAERDEKLLRIVIEKIYMLAEVSKDLIEKALDIENESK